MPVPGRRESQGKDVQEWRISEVLWAQKVLLAASQSGRYYYRGLILVAIKWPTQLSHFVASCLSALRESTYHHLPSH